MTQISDSTFEDNSEASFSFTYSTVTTTNTTFTKNRVAIMMFRLRQRSNMTIDGCHFLHNDCCPLVSLYSRSNIFISSSDFQNNKCISDQGLLSVSFSLVFVATILVGGSTNKRAADAGFIVGDGADMNITASISLKTQVMATE